MMCRKTALMALLVPLLSTTLSCLPAPGPGDPVGCSGPDPRAMAIEYRLVEATSDTTGRVEIKGIIDNYGTEEFRSGQGQQAVELYEGTTLVAEFMVSDHAFMNLALDETIDVVYERDWDMADEFRPPDYTLYLNLDPDIFIDGNEENDDCDLDNNLLEVDTAAINDFFTTGG